jgi:hypothetical protein
VPIAAVVVVVFLVVVVRGVVGAQARERCVAVVGGELLFGV